MIAVIFEAWPSAEGADAYQRIAHALRPALEQIDGFISVERFDSQTEPGKVLSLSFWRDEAAVQRWRNTSQHRGAQASGRAGVFTDYRLRVATVERDYGLAPRQEAPADSRTHHGA